MYLGLFDLTLLGYVVKEGSTHYYDNEGVWMLEPYNPPWVCSAAGMLVTCLGGLETVKVVCNVYFPPHCLKFYVI